MMKAYKASNKRIIPRGGNGRFRKTTMEDFGIGGACPSCRHLLLRHYDGDENDPFPDPRLFRYRCFTCEPKTEAELERDRAIEAERPKKSPFMQMLEEAAAALGE